MGIYADHALKYIDNGIIVIPVAGKAPVIKEWQKWCLELPSSDIVTSWLNGHGNCGLSVICGPTTGLCGLDIDTDDEEILAVIRRVLPQSCVAKRGRRGFTAFYRFDFGPSGASVPKSSLTLEAKGHRVVDVLLAKHTILPPSIHPDTKKPYEWITHQTLVDIDMDDLPLLGLDEIHELQIELSKLIGKADGVLRGTKTGRNDYLKAVLSRLIAARTPTDEAISLLIKEDEMFSPSNPLFSDKKENSGCGHIWANAVRFYSSNYHSFAKRNEKAGEKVEMPYTAMVNLKKFSEKFPNMDKGFFYLNEKGASIPDYYGFADYFIAKHKLYNRDGYNYVFEKTHYRPISDGEIEKLISVYTKRKIKNLSQMKMFYKVATSDSVGRDSVLLDTSGYINLRNGIYDLKEKKLLEHDHRFGFHYCLDYDFKPSAKCPTFLGFLDDVFEGDQETIDIIQQYMAYTLVGGYPFLHRALCFTGTGRNGKSTLIDVIRHLLGRHNVASVSLSKIDDHFQAVNLDGKLANLVEELPVDVIPPEAFKNIIGGGEVAMSKKFKDIYHKPVTARFIFATNDTPVFKDTSIGLLERIVFIEFPKYIPADQRIANLPEKLKAEISGIFNWVLEVLPFKEDFKLSHSSHSEKVKEMYMTESNNVVSWWKDCIRECDDGNIVSYGQLFVNYTDYCRQAGFKPCSKITFAKRLREYLKFNADGKATVTRQNDARGIKNIFIASQFNHFNL